MGKKIVTTSGKIISAYAHNSSGIPLFNAWISPAGEIIEVDIGYHSNFVVEYLEKEYGTEWFLSQKMSSTRVMYKFMEEHGWIRVMNWKSGEFNFVLPNRIRTPHCQIKAITNICINHNIPLPDEILSD